MAGFIVALTFMKKQKKVSIVELDANHIDPPKEYMREAEFVGWANSLENEQTRQDILGKIDRLGGWGGADFGILVFINPSKCFAGRDMLAALACLEKIRDKILQDLSI